MLHTHEPVLSGGICIAPQNGRQTHIHQARPGFDGVSVKVAGRYHGTPITCSTDLDREDEIEVNPVDPTSANSGNPNEGLVENDIKSTLRAFEDEYRDGAED